METTKTIRLISARPDVNNLEISNVSDYKVGFNLIWIDYNNGESSVAVKRSDYVKMFIIETTDVPINGDNFQRINCY